MSGQLSVYKKEYYDNNKNMINTKANKKCNCSCNGRYTIANKAYHERSVKHQKYLQESSDLMLLCKEVIDMQNKLSEKVETDNNFIFLF